MSTDFKNMKITNEIIDHIAHLSRLEFEGSEKDAIRQDMENIISFMDVLQEVDTNNVEPLIFMNDEINHLREDIPTVTLTQQEILKNAPKKDSDFFRIPKVLDK
ncbi:MAG: Asp-tRNA(Asn)/Glu-tRNA(Gln) amidotransferase subunit GatC [Crocinitomicaceae bacterium]